MLEIKDLFVEIDGQKILNGFNLKVMPSQIHAIMGPNGAGKSTLAKVLAGHPSYTVVSGEILLNGVNLLELEVEQRSHAGLFMSFQYPLEIPGCTNFDFLLAIKNAKLKASNEAQMSKESFKEYIKPKLALMNIKEEFLERDINSGFSGGEKKKNEILQMAILEPKIAILDETDSGLDIDAMRVVASSIKSLLGSETSLILITHYQRLLDYVRPNVIHVMMDGQIVKTSDASLALRLEEKGYDWICREKVEV